ncbi:MAG: PglZ domain-containing protein [Flavobacteriaceae bacterium]|nr:PglZ domain-containing protein [Flavobacteriaceae bacterium]
MNKFRILWVDDEVDFLKPHIIFLEKKNYDVEKSFNGSDALELCKTKKFDLIFLDENMPGLSGLETLTEIKTIQPETPVVMVTKSEEENLMEEAIGSKISDYLIKPVKPSQILLCLKKHLDLNDLIHQKTTSSYTQEFIKISDDIQTADSLEEWHQIHKTLTKWELDIDLIQEESLSNILKSQKEEANKNFFKYIKNNYKEIVKDKQNINSTNVFKTIINPIAQKEKTLCIVIDNLRYDQWKTISPIITEHYNIREEHMYTSILPTTTQYARNSFFAGKHPIDIKKDHPELWIDENEEGGKNVNEEELLRLQLSKSKLKIGYHKVSNLKKSNDLADNLKSISENDLTILVYNFIDIISHSKTELDFMKKLVTDDKSYRSLTYSWFKNAPILKLIKRAKEENLTLIITTDHGTINCKKSTKVISNKEINSNIRYKKSNKMTFEDKNVFEIKSPKDVFLPTNSANETFIFAKEDYFFAYNNNYNYYSNYFKNTYQHGGVSMEEMLIPLIILDPKT